MAVIAVLQATGQERAIQVLQEARESLDSREGEVVMDFSSVRRIEPTALKEMEALVDEAGAKNVRLVLRGVNVDVYRVLKQLKLTCRFTFEA